MTTTPNPTLFHSPTPSIQFTRLQSYICHKPLKSFKINCSNPINNNDNNNNINGNASSEARSNGSGGGLKNLLSGMVGEEVDELLNKEENRVLLDGLDKATQRVEMAKRELAKIEQQQVENDKLKEYINQLEIRAAEDVLNKIMSFSQNGPRAVCIMSGIGVITNVTLRQAATSGGTATYEGRFDILSLSGSFVLSEAYGQRTRTGGLSITLSGADGRVFGGVVAGLLVAASPVQVIVGSFLPENSKDPVPANHVEPSSVTPKVTPANHGTGPSSSPSHGTMSESSDGPGSSMNRGNESSPQGMASMPWK